MALLEGWWRAGQCPPLQGVPEAAWLGARQRHHRPAVDLGMLAGPPGAGAIREPCEPLGVKPVAPGPDAEGRQPGLQRDLGHLHPLGTRSDDVGALHHPVRSGAGMGQAREFLGRVGCQGSYLQCHVLPSNIYVEGVYPNFGKGPLSVYVYTNMPASLTRNDHLHMRV
jgi:hypothetical protein